MKIGFALGDTLTGLALQTYNWMCDAGFKPEFLLSTVPMFHNHESHKLFDGTYYTCDGINSDTASNVLVEQRPRCVIVYGCGIVKRDIAERFADMLINVHAGELPEFRGINNVEWAYLEDKPLVGTVHYIAGHVDSGDIIYEAEIPRLRTASSIEELRMHAFEQSFALIPKALDRVAADAPVRKQTLYPRTNRYLMHRFLKDTVLLPKMRGVLAS